MRYVLILFLAWICLVGAGYAEEGEKGSISLKDLLRAPTEVVLNKSPLSLSATLYRDFMMQPPGSKDGSPLIAIIRVATSDGSPFPEDIRVERVWVIHGEEIWQAPRIEERNRKDTSYRYAYGGDVNRPASVCEVTAHNGPKWGPGVHVDVVVRLKDGSDHRHLLRKSDQPIVGLGL